VAPLIRRNSTQLTIRPVAAHCPARRPARALAPIHYLRRCPPTLS